MRLLFVITALLIALAAPARAGVVVHIDNSDQRMQVFVDGMLAYVWPVSTARKGYRTPPGNYRVQRMERMWYSRKYDMSPMPYSLFFRGGYAIHGYMSVPVYPASHGCLRVPPADAWSVFRWIRYGTRVDVYP